MRSLSLLYRRRKIPERLDINRYQELLDAQERVGGYTGRSMSSLERVEIGG